MSLTNNQLQAVSSFLVGITDKDMLCAESLLSLSSVMVDVESPNVMDENYRRADARGIHTHTFPHFEDKDTPYEEYPTIHTTPKGIHTCVPCDVKGTDNSIVDSCLVGCSRRQRKKKLPSPQIRSHIKDKKWYGQTWTRDSEDPNVCICLLCDKKGKSATIQQHCKQHFLPEHSCNDCGDSWHIKTQWQEHFSYKCPHCSKTIKGKQNFKKHYKNH